VQAIILMNFTAIHIMFVQCIRFQTIAAKRLQIDLNVYDQSVRELCRVGFLFVVGCRGKNWNHRRDDMLSLYHRPIT
jgi:hypothetical protein